MSWIHKRINRRQSIIIDQYIDNCLFVNSLEYYIEVLRIPKNMMFGGYRNTCYDSRKKENYDR